MLGIILKILSVLGILLLILLGILFSLLLLVLFYPVTYKAQGEKNCNSAWISIRVKWLMGLFLMKFDYPDPGKLTVKLLWHTLYISGEGKKEPDKESDSEQNEELSESNHITKAGNTPVSEQEDTANAANVSENDVRSANKSVSKEGFLRKKIEKIQYTISNIYDKIKEIWENITYYTELLRDKETKQLLSLIFSKLRKIGRHICPRHLRADVLFGTGSPDTTGYLFGIYGMLSPSLGTSVTATPDFTERILEGSFNVSGHITVIVLLINTLKVLLDKKLMHVISKLKARRK